MRIVATGKRPLDMSAIAEELTKVVGTSNIFADVHGITVFVVDEQYLFKVEDFLEAKGLHLVIHPE